MKFEPEHNRAIEDAVEHVRAWGHKISFGVAADLIDAFLESLNSEDRDFSDEMIEARKRFKTLIVEQPDECAQKLWEDALQSVGRR